MSACVRVHSCDIGFVPLCTCVCLACLLQDSMRTCGVLRAHVSVCTGGRLRWCGVMSTCANLLCVHVPCACASACMRVHACAQAAHVPTCSNICARGSLKHAQTHRHLCAVYIFTCVCMHVCSREHDYVCCVCMSVEEPGRGHWWAPGLGVTWPLVGFSGGTLRGTPRHRDLHLHEQCRLTPCVTWCKCSDPHFR